MHTEVSDMGVLNKIRNLKSHNFFNVLVTSLLKQTGGLLKLL